MTTLFHVDSLKERLTGQLYVHTLSATLGYKHQRSTKFIRSSGGRHVLGHRSGVWLTRTRMTGRRPLQFPCPQPSPPRAWIRSVDFGSYLTSHSNLLLRAPLNMVARLLSRLVALLVPPFSIQSFSGRSEELHWIGQTHTRCLQRMDSRGAVILVDMVVLG